MVSALDFSADVFIEDENVITAIELKSVKPNSGEMRGEKQKILEGKAALWHKFPEKEIKFFLGFPFDPTVNPNAESPYTSNKPRFTISCINMNKYFAPDEILISSDLWDLLSGQISTMEQIIEIINSISTVEFLHIFQYLNENSNRNSQNYKDTLSSWNLLSELQLINNDETIRERIGHDRNLNRIYNKTAFDNKGNYNTDRYTALKNLL
ncbi:MAG: type site-specific deoxyribonuclease [Bacteroidota bacterium]|nr:type site-specific deoxyribonuclease [Bacteroidota bacterium]